MWHAHYIYYMGGAAQVSVMFASKNRMDLSTARVSALSQEFTVHLSPC